MTVCGCFFSTLYSQWQQNNGNLQRIRLGFNTGTKHAYKQTTLTCTSYQVHKTPTFLHLLGTRVDFRGKSWTENNTFLYTNKYIHTNIQTDKQTQALVYKSDSLNVVVFCSVLKAFFSSIVYRNNDDDRKVKSCPREWASESRVRREWK